jgi:hypothetical protein
MGPDMTYGFAWFRADSGCFAEPPATRATASTKVPAKIVSFQNRKPV